MSKEEFDLVVIGGGPAGYVGAIKAAQLGMKVACIEKRSRLGGTCLNVGCIPSKSLLDSSHLYDLAKHKFADAGITCDNLSFDLAKMMKKKEKILDELGRGIEGLFVKNKVKKYVGFGRIKSSSEVEVVTEDGVHEIGAKNIMIATGSQPVNLSFLPIDEERIVTSTGILSLVRLPKKMAVIGAGVIGLEMASVWSRLGVEVEVIEYLDRICPFLDDDVAKNFMKILEKQSIKFHLSTKVVASENLKDKVKLAVEKVGDGQKSELEFDVVLVSIGRKPYTENIGLSEVGVELNERGQVKVNHNFQTNVSNIYAVGDVIDGPMLAHKAEEDAVAAVEIMCGQMGHVDYNLVPGIIYTHPEVAYVGKNEGQLKKDGVKYKVGKFPFLANSRAKITGDTEGMVKILVDEKDTILGAHIIGPSAGELIQQIINVMAYRGSSEDIARISHGHPGVSEAVKECALSAYFKAIHI